MEVESNHRVNIILGPPGTGKTTALLNVVDRALASGTPPERIAFLAFTRKAADEAIERAMSRFGFDEDRLPYFRTLHSLAFKQLGLRRDEVMTTSHYKKLGKAMGISFRGVYDEITHVPVGDSLGDKCARVDALSRMSMRNIEEQFNILNVDDLNFHAVEQYQKALKLYKQELGLFDFTDMLEKYEGTLPIDICIFDEAQDLSSLQYKMGIKLAKHAKKIYIAGDDDQAIFGWAGADVSKFLSLKGHKIVLPRSYRIPKSVHFLASSVLYRIRNRYRKNWKPKLDRGEVEWVASEQEVKLSGEWLLLARSKYLLVRLKQVARQQGRGYLFFGKNSLNTDTTKAIISWESLRKGNSITPSEAKNIINFLPIEHKLSKKKTYTIEDIGLPNNSLKQDWMEILKLIPPDEREYIRSCLRNGEKLNEKPKIVISTIHQVKGGEADNVMILTDVGTKSWQNMHKDEELRVWYVALTRTKNKLVLVRPNSTKYFEF
jgi:DNA helicase-2/ATP-dependent DNA helicase PcrA